LTKKNEITSGGMPCPPVLAANSFCAQIRGTFVTSIKLFGFYAQRVRA
jgi:hypothetical protein